MRIGEAATGIGEQMADTGLAIQRAKDKTEAMTARAGAIDELVESGALEDFTSDQTQLDRELAQISSQSQVDSELEKMKAELGSGEKQRSWSRDRPDDGRRRSVPGRRRASDAAERARRAGGRGARGETTRRSWTPSSTRWPSSCARSGEPLPEDDLSASDLVIPPSDLTLEETRRLLSDDGLIPDLPAAS